jgi:hypothetical protein
LGSPIFLAGHEQLALSFFVVQMAFRPHGFGNASQGLDKDETFIALVDSINYNYYLIE